MKRLAMALAAGCAAPFLVAAMVPARTAPELEQLGWRKVVWTGIAPARFSAGAEGGIRVRGQGEAGFIYRRLSGAAQCLTWRWRVDAGPPPTDLRRRGGEDRAMALSVGFAGFGADVGLLDRAQHALAQGAAGEHTLPRSVLTYTWGGTGQEAAMAQRGFFPSPWSRAFTRMRVLRPATAPMGRWVEERVDLGADWRAAFGAATVPDVQEVAITTDSDDTGSLVDAQVAAIRMVPCG